MTARVRAMRIVSGPRRSGAQDGNLIAFQPG